MRIKPKGRKIYRQKTRFEKLRSFLSNTGAVVSMLVIAAILFFVGYSAGGPIIRFLEERKTVQPTEPVITPEDYEEEPSSTAEPSTELLESETEPVTEPTPETTEPAESALRGYLLTTDALLSEEALHAAMETVPAGTTHIFVPLKTAGGGIWYATKLEDAAKNGAVRAVLPPETIASVISETGAQPVAVINTLEDHIYPLSYQDAGYLIAGSGERWLDAAPDNGGRPWLSPFSSLAQDFLANLAEEVSQAGFTAIVCEGLVFPDFKSTDLEKLDTRCGDEDRYTALCDVVSAMQKAAPDAAFYAGINGIDILTNVKDAALASDSMEIEGVIISVAAATQGNSELLRSAVSAHTPVLEWVGVPVPAGEGSFVYAPGNQPEE